MADDRETLSISANDRASDETIAGSGPGVPDDALRPGAELPPPPSDEEVARIAAVLGAPIPAKSDEKAPAQVE